MLGIVISLPYCSLGWCEAAVGREMVLASGPAVDSGWCGVGCSNLSGFEGHSDYALEEVKFATSGNRFSVIDFPRSSQSVSI